MTFLPAALVLLPILAAALTTALRARPRAAGTLGLLVSVAVAALSLLLAAHVAAHGTVEQHLGNWAPPLGIAARVDATSALFLAMTAVVGLAAGVYAGRDAVSTSGAGPGRFWPVWLLAWAGMNAVYVAGDLFTIYVGLEVLGLAAVGLVALGGPKAWGPALRYLLLAVLGSLLYLVALSMIYGAVGTLDWALAGERIAAFRAGGGEPSPWPLALAAVGLGLKTALVPLHGWLPPAHGNSLPAVSPILSALVIKGSFFVLVRLWFDVLGPDRAIAAGLGVLGAAALLWGGLQALRQDGFKRVVAYSTVAQVGYFVLVFPLTAFAPDAELARIAWFGVMALVVAHAFAKAALFMAAGTYALSFGSDDLLTLRGAGRRHPMLAASAGLAAVSLAGLPISLAFTGKWHVLRVAILGGQWWWVALLVLATLVSAAYLLRPLSALLRAPEDVDDEGPAPDRPESGTPHGAVGAARAELPARLQVVPLVLATLGVAFGLWSAPLADLTEGAHVVTADPAYPSPGGERP